MPLFEFCCNQCGAVFEELVFGKDEPTPPCPKCGSVRTGRLLSRPARRRSSDNGGASAAGGGCAGCAGGNCAACH
jgi:putative FmdB family regulatory protein